MDALTEALVQLAILVATGLATYAVKKYRDWSNANVSEKQRAELDKALLNSIKWAINQTASGSPPTTRQIVDDAAVYIYANLPGIVKALGLDDNSVRKLIEARIEPEAAKSGF